MELFIKQFESHVEDLLSKQSNKTEDGKTQECERNIKKIILTELIKHADPGTTITEAGQQQAIDFRNFCYKGVLYNFECKKCDKGNSFKFNDTMVKDEVYYILIYEKYKKVRIILGYDISLLDNNFELANFNNLIKLINSVKIINKKFIFDLFNITLNLAKECVYSGIMSIFDFGEMFKTTINFGNVSSRPRPNWTILIPLSDRQPL